MKSLYNRLAMASSWIALYATLCTDVSAQVTGTVFRDFNANGYRDNTSAFFEPGVPNAVLHAYGPGDLPGIPSFITTTGSNGNYIFVGLTSGVTYRIELVSYPNYLLPGVAPTSSVRFVTDGNSGIDFGLNNPADYCESNPPIVTNCFVEHNQLSGPTSTLDVLVQMPYSAGNATATLPGVDNPSPLSLSIANQIGTTYGLAYQRSSQSIFASAFMKRHSGFGPGGTGAIYRIDVGSGSVSLFADINALFGPSTAGVDPHPTNATNSNEWRRDAASWDPTGKISFGDIDISEDELYLWAINLADRRLYKISLQSATNPVPPTVGDIDIYPTSGDLTGLPGLVGPNLAVNIRPFGLGVKDGMVYIGLVHTAETTQSPSDLRGFVYRFNPVTETFTKVLDFPLNYPRGNAVRASPLSLVSANWNPWAPSFTVLGPVFGSEYAYPQPIISDIVFDARGNMIIGFRDRFGDQMGYDQLSPNPGDNNSYSGDSAGDLLMASEDGSGGWTIESNAASNPPGTFGPSGGAGNNQGPGGGEFFYQDRFPVSTTAIHDEVIVGGLLMLAGTPHVAATQYDPIDDPSTAFDGGIFWMNTSTGQRSRAYRVFNGGVGSSGPYFGKSNGLGDLEAMCSAAPIEIGNRVWNDLNQNGIQDPNEPVIAGVPVELYKETSPGVFALIASAVTDANGNYYFSSASGTSTASLVYGVAQLQPNMSYELLSLIHI